MSNNYSRRTVLQACLATGALSPVLSGLSQENTNNPDRFLVCVQVRGGWDPTSFCDPKTNVPGERVINHWAQTAEIEQSGNIPYAPFGANAQFFEKYYDRILVINGVDSQTNSHDVGVVNGWSGRVASGYPSISALYASDSVGMALPYLSFGGYSQTHGVTRLTRLQGGKVLQHVGRPNQKLWNAESTFVGEEDWKSLQEFSVESARSRLRDDSVISSSSRLTSNYLDAMSTTDQISEYADEIDMLDGLEPVQAKASETGKTFRSTLRRQSQMAVLAFKSGVSVSADLNIGGFDSHDSHDANHAVTMALLTDGIDFLWDFAETHGIADKLFVLIGSEFGRTNFYNKDEGKDHWPIGSYLLMEKGKNWTNRVVGSTDASHFAQKINSETLAPDDSMGSVILRPKHVHQSIRRYLGIEDSVLVQQFPLHSSEQIDFFTS